VSVKRSIPNLPTGTKTVRLHFAEIHNPHPGERIFNIKINDVVRYATDDISGHTQGTMYYGIAETFTGVTVDANGVVTVELAPSGGVYWTASVNGIEILKP